MQVYKASKILILHFKRFKQKNLISKKKIEAIIEFPFGDTNENALDLSDFVINHNLPSKYHVENI